MHVCRIVALALSIAATAACGGTSSPSAPTPTPPPVATNPPAPAPPPAAAFSGTVTDTLSGAPVPGFTASPSGNRLLVAAPGYITRETRLGVATLDLIPENAFDLDFYRQFARGSLNGSLQPLRVLRQAPSFYIEVEGAKGLSAQIGEQLQAIARRVVPELTGGMFQMVHWETGPTPRPPQNGWIVIERRDEPSGICGRATVGAAAGQIWLDGNRQCNIAAVFAHELGHALGFWHVDIPGSLMFPRDRASNIADAPTERERRHAAIAYRRAAGNLDVDVDP